ncbi:hypothetical protein HDU96_004177, partial [Phlyctochytrium bullatum]
MGVLALDLQDNQITDVGARIVEQVLHLNKEVVIIDIRNNAVDPTLMSLIFARLDQNAENIFQTDALHSLGTLLAEFDLFWLDPEYPLLPSFFDIVSRHSTAPSTVRHTISSLKKRTFPKTTYQPQQRIVAELNSEADFRPSRPASAPAARPGKAKKGAPSGGVEKTKKRVGSGKVGRRGSGDVAKMELPVRRANSPTRLPQVAWEGSSRPESPLRAGSAGEILRSEKWRRMFTEEIGNGTAGDKWATWAEPPENESAS